MNFIKSVMCRGGQCDFNCTTHCIRAMGGRYRGPSGGFFLPSQLSPIAWFRYGMGITVTGAGVSQWDDQSGNGNHLLQGTDAARPSLEADNSILFDGVGQFLKCDAFTLEQPTTVYWLGSVLTWGLQLRLFDGNALNTMGLFCGNAAAGGESPNIVMYAGSYGPENLAGNTVGSYHVIAAVFNGASSVLSVDSGASSTGDAGANNAGGLILGSGSTTSDFINEKVKEAIVFPDAHDATTRAQVITYLQTVGNLV